MLQLIKNNVLALLAIIIAFYTATVYMQFNMYLMGTLAIVALILFCAWAYNNELRRKRAVEAQEKINSAGYENSIDLEGSFETIDPDTFLRAMSGDLSGMSSAQPDERNNSEPKARTSESKDTPFKNSLTAAQKDAFQLLDLPLEMTTKKAVRHAFHKLVRGYHPDSNTKVSHDESVEKIQQLKKAKKIVEQCIKCSDSQ